MGTNECCGKTSLVPIEGGIPKAGTITITKMVNKGHKRVPGDSTEVINFWPWECVNCGAVFYFPRSLEVVYDAYSKTAEKAVIVFDEETP